MEELYQKKKIITFALSDFFFETAFITVVSCNYVDQSLQNNYFERIDKSRLVLVSITLEISVSRRCETEIKRTLGKDLDRKRLGCLGAIYPQPG